MTETITERYNLDIKDIKVKVEKLIDGYSSLSIYIENTHLCTFHGPDAMVAVGAYIKSLKNGFTIEDAMLLYSIETTDGESNADQDSD